MRKTPEEKQITDLKRTYGPKVDITRKSIGSRSELNAVIDHAGKDITPAGLKYAGSVTIFMYVDDMVIKTGGGSIASATNFTGDMAMSLPAIKALLDSARVDIVSHFTAGRGDPNV